MGLIVVQYNEKYFQSKLDAEPLYAVLQTSNIKAKHRPRMLGIDERMKKMFFK